MFFNPKKGQHVAFANGKFVFTIHFEFKTFIQIMKLALQNNEQLLPSLIDEISLPMIMQGPSCKITLNLLSTLRSLMTDLL
jgi:hypothetical protein